MAVSEVQLEWRKTTVDRLRRLNRRGEEDGGFARLWAVLDCLERNLLFGGMCGGGMGGKGN